MKTLGFILQKEFKQILRDRIILAMIVFMPIAQLTILPLASNFEVRNVNVSVVDHDQSTTTHKITGQIQHSSSFRLVYWGTSMDQAMAKIEDNTADVILEFPFGYERDALRGGGQGAYMAVNAINGIKGNLGASYLSQVLREYQASMATASGGALSNAGIELHSISRFNIHLDYRRYMVPGILALLLSIVAVYLTALNIVREKEVGTIEQINVTPITRYQFLAGKLIPFLILNLFLFTLGLVIGNVVYGVVPAGNLVVLYGVTILYLMAVLGLGLLISTYANTQQQAMFVAFFFMMIFIMLGGLFTPIGSMPHWAQAITYANPVRYYIDILRMIILKGSGLVDLRLHLAVIGGMALLFNTWAVLNYRKTS